MSPAPLPGHRGTVAPLRRRDVDTDQIIPAEFCKRLGRTGYADTLFHRWREDPGFVLNQPAFGGASILVAGPDFGIGSSREHAVWALRDFGFRAVVAPGFGDIFRANAGKNQLLTAQVTEAEVERLWQLVEAAPDTVVALDLTRRTVAAGGRRFPFSIDDHSRRMLIDGLDDIQLTARRAGSIEEHEAFRPGWLPRTPRTPQSATD
ncbi:3-isopropylmalate dehydratase small subunit [Streptomyces alboflavus]|uniref:3-isopropylmalate dehydratase small subunit n=1 Tax=Streptomyces alboflavus TaxID=67267 RepID=UPI0036B3263D